jgi:hypothetical protein
MPAEVGGTDAGWLVTTGAGVGSAVSTTLAGGALTIEALVAAEDGPCVDAAQETVLAATTRLKKRRARLESLGAIWYSCRADLRSAAAEM